VKSRKQERKKEGKKRSDIETKNKTVTTMVQIEGEGKM
jgi:hypothetical protein